MEQQQKSTEAENGKNGSGIPSLQARGTQPACEQSGTQKNIKVCPHPHVGCISSKGYTCLHGGPCDPVDSEGRHFTVRYIMHRGERLACKTLADQSGIGTAPFQYRVPAPILCADTVQAAKEAEIRGAA